MQRKESTKMIYLTGSSIKMATTQKLEIVKFSGQPVSFSGQENNLYGIETRKTKSSIATNTATKKL